MNYYLDKIYSDKEFIDTISDIIENPTVQEMKNFRQHYETTCFDHCYMVSYYCYLICKKYNLDYVSATRAGMLHDLFLYDWRKQYRAVELPGLHAFVHPQIALENASKIFELNDIEKDVIVKHMWPVTFALPKYRESYIVTLMDKYSACVETYNYTLYTRREYHYTYQGESHTGHETTHEDKTEYTRTTTESYIPSVKVTYAKTWYSEQTIEYERIRVLGETETYEKNASNDETLQDEPRLTGDETGTWKEDQVKSYRDTTKTSEINEVNRTDVDYSILGEKGDSEDGKETFIALMETEYRIPYSTREEAAGSKKPGAYPAGIRDAEEQWNGTVSGIRSVLSKTSASDSGQAGGHLCEREAATGADSGSCRDRRQSLFGLWCVYGGAVRCRSGVRRRVYRQRAGAGD